MIVGGRGPRRTPEPAARFADDCNMPFRSVADTAAAFRRARLACDRYARPADRPLTLSAGVVAAVGRTDAQARRRPAPRRVPSALPPEDPVVGPPDRLVERIGEPAAAGTTRIRLRLIDMTDLDHLDVIAERVLPQVATLGATSRGPS